MCARVMQLKSQLDGGVGGPGSWASGRNINQAVVEVPAIPTSVHSHQRVRLAATTCGMDATSIGLNSIGNVYSESARTSWLRITSL